jgi:membrane protease YdiL (CAAX protease family)
MQTLTELFWNPTDRRLRALWRLILHMLMVFAGLRAFSLILSLFSRSGEGNGGSGPSIAITMVALLFTGLIYFAATILAAKFLDRRNFRDFGMAWNAQWRLDLYFGLALGALLIAAIFVFQLAMGWITVDTLYVTLLPFPFAAALLVFLIQFTLVGTYEELIFRGYQLKNIAEGFTFGTLSARTAVLIALLISSITFGLIHAFNPNATTATTINIALAGIFLGLPFVLTGRLAISIGIHIAWNFFQGNVFGFPVSGNVMFRTTVFDTVQGGPDLWTGGVFGPEAGLLGIAVMITGALLSVWWVKRTRGAVGFALSVAEYQPQPPVAPNQ